MSKFRIDDALREKSKEEILEILQMTGDIVAEFADGMSDEAKEKCKLMMEKEDLLEKIHLHKMIIDNLLWTQNENRAFDKCRHCGSKYPEHNDDCQILIFIKDNI